jgi:hypothetical protein
MLKQMVMSATYRQASLTNQRSAITNQQSDPDNHLLWHAPPRRLTAEMLRDSALSASGLLVEKLGGPSVKPYQPPGLWEEIAMGRPSYGQGKGDDLHRRSLYTFGNAPSAAGNDDLRRRRSQLLRRPPPKHEHAAAGARAAQRRPIRRGRPPRRRRRHARARPRRALSLHLFRAITSRRPQPRELDVLRRLFTEQRDHFTAEPSTAQKLLTFGEAKHDPALPAPDLAAFTIVAQTLQNHDEAIMRR